MSILLKKSEQNKLAFGYLKDKEVFAAIVHCGYYSCFQKVSHILNEYYPAEMAVIHQQLKERRKGSMHTECIKEFIIQFRSNFGLENAVELDNNLKQLKALRLEADYGETEVTPTMVDKAERYMNSFHLLTKQNFQV